MKQLNLFFKILLCVLLSVCVVLLSVDILVRRTDDNGVTNGNGSAIQNNDGETPAYLDKVTEILSLIDTYYVDDYTTDQLGDYLAAAVISSTGDRWSYYVSAEDYDTLVEQNNNAYVGIGVTIEDAPDEGGVRIVSVTHNSPAELAQRQNGDVIVAVEGQDVAELGMNGAKNLVRGEAGTDVRITILRDGKRFDVTITRQIIETEVVVSELLDNGYGYIKINNFDTHCARDSIAAIDDLIAQGATALIFDVRFNPGGYKHELVEVLDYLLPEGPLFRSVDYLGKEEVDYSEESFIDLPMAVLVNEDSYSAAEFFAVALQEYGAAVVVGTQTSGKANYQQTFRLSDGSAVAISTGHYQTPNGVTLAGVGITPDIPVPVDDETYANLYYEKVSKADDAQLQAAIAALDAKNEN